MQRLSIARNLCHKIMQCHYHNHSHNRNQMVKSIVKPPCDVFINHRGIDTKRTISGLLFHHLARLGINPFLDSKNMKPGDKLFDKIDAAIGGCKLAVTVFSPSYCSSYFCLHELALIMETKKRIIPVFCDVKPSQLVVKDNGCYPAKDVRRFNRALEQAKYTVGLTFDTDTGDWSEFLTTAADAVVENLIELDGEEAYKSCKNVLQKYYY